ncbi:MAG: thioesterase family protein [Candidatus Sericytochromatia bacterium]
MTDLLKNYPVIIEIPVAWGEMDAFQHVNNVAYIRYLESGRTKYFDDLNYLNYMKETGFGPILLSISCKYKLPLSYPDTLLLGTRIYKMTEDRAWMKHEIFSQKLQKITTEGEGIWVSYDYNKNKKCPIPEVIKNKILEFENGNIDLV